jgi:hypothetical protein
MSEATKVRRVEKAKKLLVKIKHPSALNQLIFFSDDRWLCSNPSEVPIVMSIKFPFTVMVLGVVSNEGDVMPPHFFPKGLKINMDEYIRVLEEVVKPWMDEMAGGRPYVVPQDGALAHNSKRTQDWRRENLPEFWVKELWPFSSPDCNPLDYFVWGISELHVIKMPNNTQPL